MFKFSALVVLVALSVSSTAFACGEERWDVKVLKDESAARINMQPVDKTVTALLQLVASGEGGEQRSPFERQAYRVKAVVVGLMNNSADSDFHIVIADPQNLKQTMIVEIPLPDCASPQFADTFARARDNFVHQVGYPTPDYTRLGKPVPVEVVGIGFFDRVHGEKGQAPNGVELHPVLEIHSSQAEALQARNGMKRRHHPGSDRGIN